MKKLEYAEFYITNVCNLNCQRCNRFNNYAFSGHVDWQSHANDYVAWSRRLDIDRIGILGGEPMLHPEFVSWVKHVADLWPRANVMIISNGTQLRRHPDLYDLFQQYHGRIRLDISRHNALAREQTLRDIESIYPRGFERFDLVDANTHDITGAHGHWTHSSTPENRKVIDPDVIGPEIWQDKSFQVVYRDRYATIRYSDADNFDEAVIRWDAVNRRLYTNSTLSNPDIAASNCNCKFSHHFLHGRLYKCGIVAVLPEFLKQFPVDMPNDHRVLLDSYAAAEHDWDDQRLDAFIDNLSQGSSVPQCALCPETHDPEKFVAGTKKIKIHRLTPGVLHDR
jgi:hypothetical protein